MVTVSSPNAAEEDRNFPHVLSHACCWQPVIVRHILARYWVRWLSGRKQRFAKAPYPKRVPRVRIPPSPPCSRRGKSPHRTRSRTGDENLFDRWGAKRMG